MGSAAFVLDDTANAFQLLIGPKDQCVPLRSDIKKNVKRKPIKLAFFTGSYREQVT
jgi:hypothetical protein